MSVVSEAKAVLEADVTLVALATGGIYDYAETGPNGISRTTTPAAFDSNEIIKPCILLKSRGSTPDLALTDEGAQYLSTREALECWFYDDTGYSNIEAMRDRVYTLLHAVQLAGTFKALWAGDVRNQRDTSLDANVERSEYTVYTYKD
jgi:hypothetical protein